MPTTCQMSNNFDLAGKSSKSTAKFQNDFIIIMAIPVSLAECSPTKNMQLDVMEKCSDKFCKEGCSNSDCVVCD